MLSLDGFEVCISGKGNGGALLLLRSLTTLYLPHEHVRYAKALEKTAEKLAYDKNYKVTEWFNKITPEKNLELFEYFAEKNALAIIYESELTDKLPLKLREVYSKREFYAEHAAKLKTSGGEKIIAKALDEYAKN